MKTVAEILRETGLSDEQIAALDPKVTAGLTQVVSSASQTLEAAELAKRAQAAQYDTEIAPALDAWANEKADLTARNAFLEASLKGAAEGGFKVPVLPAAPAARTPDGKFVAGAPGGTPGSPQFMTRDEAFRAVSNTSWVMTEYMRLHNGAPMPDDIEVLANEAAQNKMPLRDYAAKKYAFSEKREKIAADAKQKERDAIVKETEERVNRTWAEKGGNNPNTRIAVESQFPTLEKAVKDGTRPDPLKQTREQRHASTGQNIRKEIAEHETVQ